MPCMPKTKSGLRKFEDAMKKRESRSVMIFTLAARKFNELVNFIDHDAKSLTVLTAVETVSSGAIFQQEAGTEVYHEGQ